MSSELPIEQCKTEIEEYHKLEINEIFERTRNLINARLQAGTFLGTANLTVLSFAFSTQRAGLFFIAAGVMAIFLAVEFIASEYGKGFYARGVQLEEKYASDAADAILHRRLSSHISRKGYYHRATMSGVWLFVVITLVELASGILLWLAGWRIF